MFLRSNERFWLVLLKNLQVLLKKAEYHIKLYRIGGTERLIQKLLRDDDGNAVKLHVTQRQVLLFIPIVASCECSHSLKA